jgi:hypothetical protein
MYLALKNRGNSVYGYIHVCTHHQHLFVLFACFADCRRHDDGVGAAYTPQWTSTIVNKHQYRSKEDE